MKHRSRYTPAESLTVVALVVAAVGVTLQIVSGAPYPAVPPAYFILLLPAAVIGVARTWWAPILAVLGGVFLIFGLFAAGQAHRLTGTTSAGDAVGLWMQTLAVIVAVVSGIVATRSRLAKGSVQRG
jgi:hypothetical protein